jgi:hypothetical protein
MRALPNGARSAHMIGALRAVSTGKARGRPKLSLLTFFGRKLRGRLRSSFR